MTAQAQQYRLLAGSHEHQGRMYEAGQIITSDFDLTIFNMPGYRPKFENIAGTTGAGNMVWDPKAETIDQFATRMKQLPPPKVEGPALVWDPKVETLDQFYQRVSRGSQPPVTPTSDATNKLEQGNTSTSAKPTAASKTPAQLEAMSVTELTKYAEAEEIDLGHAKTKVDIIKVIRAYQNN